MTTLDGFIYQGYLPWVAGLVTAVCFGFLAARAKVNWVLWGVGGACFGLLTTTVVVGLGEAVFIPMSQEAVGQFKMKCVAVTVVLLAVFGWIFTISLHGYLLPFCRWGRKPAAKTSPPPAS
jgi:hypothetical protein